ncbi:MAG TPA: cation diffusion facilitator family transporter [Bryobacteraceae bacterium]|jgi:cation diffusion facilitator family transporter|nr:cation diffusion facilitator family transporter [Bryobacteraceae bacterium]
MERARQIAILGMLVSGLLAILKITVGILAHSAAVSADGFESATDVFTSGLVLVGLVLAARPADENHPYGHGRVEILTGLLLGGILVCAGAGISWHGWTGAADETHVPASYAVWPLVISIGVKSCLLLVKFRHGRQIGSSSLVADAANDAMDMLSGFVALLALSLTLRNPTRFLRADHYGAAIVGLIVIGTGIRVMYESSMHLMDTMPDERSMARIRQVALSVRDVAGVEKCFARKTGFKYHVDLHLEVDPEITVRASHEIATRVRDKIRGELPWVADVLVHVEPYPGN